MGKPIHPAVVHFPIAFLILGYGMDILYQLRPNLPAAITDLLPINAELTRASYYLLSLGLIAAIPSIVTGGAEAVKMFTKQGIYEADGKTIKTKVKATVAHAAIADLTMALTAYVWYARRTAANNTIAGKLGITSEALYAPLPLQVGIEALALVLISITGNIGGTLTYNFGVGFSSASAGVKKTQ